VQGDAKHQFPLQSRWPHTNFSKKFYQKGTSTVIRVVFRKSYIKISVT